MRISFLGDTMCEPLLLAASKTPEGDFDFKPTFEHIKPLVGNSDYVVCNLETPLAGPDAEYTNSLFSFNAPDSFARALKDLGVDLVLTANNHCLDRGVEGAARTIEVLNSVGLEHVGSFLRDEPDDCRVAQINGKRVAFVSATYGSNYASNACTLPDDAPIRIMYLNDPCFTPGLKPNQKPNPAKEALKALVPHEKRIALKRRLGLNYYNVYVDDDFDIDAATPYLTHVAKCIAKAKSEADFVVFCPHMGGQFNRQPGAFSNLVMDIAKEYGADAVISSHPHVVQKATIKEGVPRFYSLGNLAMSPSSIYLLPQNKPEYGIIAHVDFDDSGVTGASYSITRACENSNGQLVVKPVFNLHAGADSDKQKRILADVQEIAGVVGSAKSVDTVQAEYRLEEPKASASIIIPAYNAQASIERTLKSLTEQTWDNLEIIVVDDGSTDSTPQLIHRFAKMDSRVACIDQSNSGVSAARNRGLEAAKGDYVFFCDADDWLDVDALESMLRFAQASGADVITADHFVEQGSGRIRKQIFPHSFMSDLPETRMAMQELMLRLQPVRMQNPNFNVCYGLGGAAWHHLIKRSVIENAQLAFDSKLDGLLEDGLFMTNVFAASDRIGYLHQAFYHYRSDDDSSTHGYLPDFSKRCTNALKAFIGYAAQHRPDPAYHQALCARAAYFAKKLCDVDFMHPDNPLPEKERYRQFVDAMKSNPFDCLLPQLDAGQFLSRSEKIQANLLSKGQFKAYWHARKAKAKLDQRKRS